MNNRPHTVAETVFIFACFCASVMEAKMNELNVVHRSLENKALSHDLADSLFDRILYGKAVIVTDRPHALHSSVKKRWQHLIRRLQIEQARTLSKSTRQNVSSQLLLVQSITFSSQLPTDFALDATITFLNADDCARIAPTCHTLYVTYTFPKEKLYLMTCWMSKSGLVVIYG